ncbi:MAG: zinc ribbon domain-containing protein [Erysipelotrichaceae bacterium]|nr:zinc ribbon domain-containing protein [Erysipelotrichaceae bacterium]
MSKIIEKYCDAVRAKYEEVKSPTIYITFDDEERDFREEFGAWLVKEGLASSYEPLGKNQFHCELSSVAIDQFVNKIVSENKEVAESVTSEEKKEESASVEPSTVNCRKCGATIDKNLQYCPKCGTPVKRICSKCGTVLNDDQDFCPNCGTKYSDGIRAVDVKNSTNAVKGKIKDNKKKIIIAVACLLLLVGGYFGFKALTKPNFDKMVKEVIENHKTKLKETNPDTDYSYYESAFYGEKDIFPAAVKIGKDGNWIKIDTNPNDEDSDDRNETESMMYYFSCTALIEYINEKLGFSDEVMESMNSTTANMGQQSAESKKATVKWSYHPDNGLEVTYTLK